MENSSNDFARGSNVDAILQRLMPTKMELNVDLEFSADNSDIYYNAEANFDDDLAHNRTKMTTESNSLLSSFDDITGVLSDFLIPNSTYNPESSIVVEPYINEKTAHIDNLAKKYDNAETKTNIKPPSGQHFDDWECSLYRNFSHKFTHQLISLLQKMPSGCANLVQITRGMSPSQKRRAAEVVNILEGLDLVETSSENAVKWKGNILLNENGEKRFEEMRNYRNDLWEEEKAIDEKIKFVKQRLLQVCEDPENAPYAYTSTDDVNGVFTDSFNFAMQVPTSALIRANIVERAAEPNKANHQLIVSSKYVSPKLALLNGEFKPKQL